MISLFLNKLPKSLYLIFNKRTRNKEMEHPTFEDLVDDVANYYERYVKEDEKDKKSGFNTHTTLGGGDGDKNPKFKGSATFPGA